MNNKGNKVLLEVLDDIHRLAFGQPMPDEDVVSIAGTKPTKLPPDGSKVRIQTGKRWITGPDGTGRYVSAGSKIMVWDHGRLRDLTEEERQKQNGYGTRPVTLEDHHE